MRTPSLPGRVFSLRINLKENTRFTRRRSSGRAFGSRVFGKTNVYFPGLVSSPQRARDKESRHQSARSDQSDALVLSSWILSWPLVLSSFLDGAKSHDRTSRVQAPDLTAQPIIFSKDDRHANSPHADDDSSNQIPLSPSHLREISRRERQDRNQLGEKVSRHREKSWSSHCLPDEGIDQNGSATSSVSF